MKTPDAAPSDQTALSGLVERVTYHSSQTGYAVIRLKVGGRRDLVTVVGHLASVKAGEYLRASGRWVNHRDHGLQFQAEFMRCTPPTSLEGIEKYLGSGLIRGIGPHYAHRLVRTFGEEVLDVIEHEPERLTGVAGIGAKRAASIGAAWAEQKVIREIMLFLQSHGVGTSRAVRIYKTYGADAVAIVGDNPYRLARDIRGIGFKTADRIASRLGIARDAMIRVRAGLTFALGEAVDQGHCGLPRDHLLAFAQDVLEVPATNLEQALALELEAGTIIADTIDGAPCVFLRRLWEAERFIAERLAELGDGRPPWGTEDPDDIEADVAWAETTLDMTLAPSQRQAVIRALSSKALVVTGGPGVGKTTLVKAILRILDRRKVSLALAAPTGRAAKRLSETTGMAARTIHRLLEVDPANGGFRRSAETPLGCDLLVLDETSMIDVPLMAAVLRALPRHAALLLVGDVDQLPSVGPGQVLRDIIASTRIPVARLTEIFRQAAESRIIVNAHKVNAGRLPDLKPHIDRRLSDFYFVEATDAEDILRKMTRIVAGRIPRRFGFDPVREIQVLCPMNRGALGTRALNMVLQETLNPITDGPFVERFGQRYHAGDKVMQIVNNYDKDVFNGDIGLVEGLDEAAETLTVDYEGRPVVYGYGELDELTLAYAVSVHKSQGSEYPAVVLPIATSQYMMLRRNLLYTGMTRGRKLVILVGQPKAIAIAVRETGGRRRWSKLREWLRPEEETARSSGDMGRSTGPFSVT